MKSSIHAVQFPSEIQVEFENRSFEREEDKQEKKKKREINKGKIESKRDFRHSRGWIAIVKSVSLVATTSSASAKVTRIKWQTCSNGIYAPDTAF